jgi:hypothetical protein
MNEKAETVAVLAPKGLSVCLPAPYMRAVRRVIWKYLREFNGGFHCIVSKFWTVRC